jgi:hypothetical protein
MRAVKPDFMDRTVLGQQLEQLAKKVFVVIIHNVFEGPLVPEWTTRYRPGDNTF